MKLIKKTGLKETFSKKGNMRRRQFGLFLCDMCGKEIEAELHSGINVTTCLECRPQHKKSLHGMSETRQYDIWKTMVQRCTNQKDKSYKYYGKKGITVDRAWLKFESFWNDMKGSYFSDGTIDRIDSSGDYCKNNCQWLPLEENIAKDKIKEVAQFEISGKGKNIIYVTRIATFCSVLEASEVTGFHKAGIARCARGDRRKANGYGWKYTE